MHALFVPLPVCSRVPGVMSPRRPSGRAPGPRTGGRLSQRPRSSPSAARRAGSWPRSCACRRCARTGRPSTTPCCPRTPRAATRCRPRTSCSQGVKPQAHGVQVLQDPARREGAGRRQMPPTPTRGSLVRSTPAPANVQALGAPALAFVAFQLADSRPFASAVAGSHSISLRSWGCVSCPLSTDESDRKAWPERALRGGT